MNKDIIDVMIEDKVENIDKIVEKDCKIKPKNILFIDDNKENIEGAKNRGWNTCLATGHELDKIKSSINEFLNLK